MKWSIGLIVLAGGGAIALAFALLDGASASLFAFATVLVMALGAAPVVLGVLTRRGAARARRGPPPTVVSTSDRPPAEGPPAPKAPGSCRGRDRGHRRPKV